MIPILITLGGTVVAGALTWQFCMRPMLRSRTTTGGSRCCAPQAPDIQDELRRTHAELAQLRTAPTTGDATLT